MRSHYKISTGMLGRIFFILALILLLQSAFVIVPAGHRGVVFSKFTGIQDVVYNEGFNFKIPLIETVQRIEVRTDKIEKSSTSTSQDQQLVEVSVAVNFKPDPTRVNKLIQEVGVSYVDRVLHPAIQDSVKSVMGMYKAEDLIQKRSEVGQKILENLELKVQDKYLMIERVNIVDIEFSEVYNKAIEEKVVAEQLERKARNDLKRIEIEAQQKIVQANATAQAKIIEATAEAQAIQTKQRSLESSPEFLKYQWIEAWNGELPHVLSGQDQDILLAIDTSENSN